MFRLKDNLNKGILLLINANCNLLNSLATMLRCSFYDGQVFGLSLGWNGNALHLILERIFTNQCFSEMLCERVVVFFFF